MPDAREPERDTIIVEEERVREAYTQVPNYILRHADLSPGAKITYAMLLSYAWQEGACYPGQARLARDIGASERSVIRYLQELQAERLVRVKRRGLGKTNVYILARWGDSRNDNLAEPEVTDVPGSDNLADPDLPGPPGGDNLALPEVTESAPPELPNRHRKKTQREEDPDGHDDPCARARADAPGSLFLHSSRRSASIDRVIADLSRQLHDLDGNEGANQGQARRIWMQTGLEEAEFVLLCYQARDVALRASIQKRNGRNPNRMPYFFRVLRALAGLDAAAAANA